MRPPYEYEHADDPARQRPARVRATLRELRQAAVLVSTGDIPCERCQFRRAQTILKCGDGPIKRLCRLCKEDERVNQRVATQKTRAASMRPR
jgi:hypothetical protein